MTYSTLRSVACLCMLLAVTLTACDSGMDAEPVTLQPDSPVAGVETDAPRPIPLADIPRISSRSAILEDLDKHVSREVAKRLKRLDKDGKRKLQLANVRAQQILNGPDVPASSDIESLQAELDEALAPVLTPGDRQRIEAAARRLAELPLVTGVPGDLSLGKVDPCTDRCSENYTVEVVSMEIAYMSALVACSFTGPIAIGCWSAATVTRTAGIVASTVVYSNCLEACREAGGS